MHDENIFLWSVMIARFIGFLKNAKKFKALIIPKCQNTHKPGIGYVDVSDKNNGIYVIYNCLNTPYDMILYDINTQNTPLLFNPLAQKIHNDENLPSVCLCYMCLPFLFIF